MTKKNETPVKQKAVESALKLAEARGWQNISLSDIARDAELDMAVMHDSFEDRFDVLAALGRMIDRKVLENIASDNHGLPERDRLFDIMMERFDVLNDYRGGLTSILSSFKTDPKQAVISLPHLGRSMSWMLEAAGIETAGIKGAVKVIGLTGIYLKTLRVWCDDESPDMGKTMAALDKNLGQAEEWAGRLAL
ncbi:MAG: TetR family transcriptional regulator [Pseudomonadota bacterium]|nr:TetR family transcriptional regulator [Pseudomonadota bacterium]